MKKHLLIAVLVFTFTASRSQSAFQAGVTMLPVFDVLNLFPDNQLSGIALSGNLGSFYTKNLAIGINPFYGQVQNGYMMGLQVINEQVKCGGMNAYARIYLFNKSKFRVYGLLSVGTGFLITEQQFSVFAPSLRYVDAVGALMAGGGFNYLFTEKVTLDFNISYMQMDFVTPRQSLFRTVVPTVGLQFFWGQRGSS